MPDEDAEAKARRAGNKRKRGQVDGRGTEPKSELAAGARACPRCRRVIPSLSKVCKSCHAAALTSDSDSPAGPFAPRVQVLKQVLRTDSSSAELSLSDDEDANGAASSVRAAEDEDVDADEESDREDDAGEESDRDEEFLDYAVLQEKETSDQPLVTWGKRHKPMIELPAGSDVWVQVVVVQTREDQILVQYMVPKTKMVRSEWIFRSSSRLWRGSNASRVWKHLGGNHGDGTWRPRAPEEIQKGRKARARLALRPPKSQPAPGTGVGVPSRSKLTGAMLAFQTTATGGRTSGSGAANAHKGEEPDVASPRKRPRAHDEADDSEQGHSGGHRHARARGKAAGGRADRDPLASWFQRHFAALDDQRLLGASFAVGAPEAGWLPPPDSSQPDRGKSGLAPRTGHAIVPGKAPQTAADGAAPTDQHQTGRPEPPGKSSTQASIGPAGRQLGTSQTAAGRAPKAEGPAVAPQSGLHSTQQRDGAQAGQKLEHKPGLELKQPSLDDEQRLFGLGLSSPSSLKMSHGGQTLSGTSLSKSKSLPKNGKGRVEELPDRQPGRSVRSGSAPQRGSISLGSQPHGRPSNADLSTLKAHLSSAASKAAPSHQPQPQKEAADRGPNRANAGQGPRKRQAGAVPAGSKHGTGALGHPAATPAAGRKHGIAAKVLVPLADDEQPGGFHDRSGWLAPQKPGAVQAAAVMQAPAGKAAQHGVRANGFHARPA